MAISIEKANQRLVKILDKLNEAIDERDAALADAKLTEITRVNEQSEGKVYDRIIPILERLNQKIADEINQGGLDATEITQLTDIKQKVKNTLTPFKNIDATVARLENMGITTQDLVDYQQGKIDANNMEIEAINETLKENVKLKVSMEHDVIDAINAEKRKAKIVEEIKKAKDTWDRVSGDPSLAQAKESAKNKVNEGIEKLRKEGVDVRNLLNWETDATELNALDKATFENEAKFKAKQYAYSKPYSDFVSLYTYDSTTGTMSITADDDEVLEAVEDKFKKLIVDSQKLQTKVNTKKTENRQMEAQLTNIKGQETKTDDEIIEEALNDSELINQANDAASRLFDGTRNPFKRIGQKMQYFREIEGNNGVLAFLRAIVPVTYNRTKRLATEFASNELAQNRLQSTRARTQEGVNEFKRFIREAAAKEMSKATPNLDEDKLKEEGMKKAIDTRGRD